MNRSEAALLAAKDLVDDQRSKLNKLERVVVELERLALAWTSDMPKEPGSYFYRSGPDDDEPCVLWVERWEDGLRPFGAHELPDWAADEMGKDRDSRTLDSYRGEWMGPLEKLLER